jgi:hypothetical protein
MGAEEVEEDSDVREEKETEEKQEESTACSFFDASVKKIEERKFHRLKVHSNLNTDRRTYLRELPLVPG